ncbi:hypothetical protein [Fangia hongkongensis]|uniref:hypothetical protein n=1 Tax=Fangia hongkongensis TaxID=270495 RepID=UPI000369D939|nr:hypothetical protein [Fangia hongkongensis]MBK2125289.1 hypothetical protein [Fangia hongkongensis]
MQNSNERLILATQTYNIETVWMQGYAFGQKNTQANCPYAKDSREAQYWNEGFDAGMFDEKPLFPDHAIDVDEKRSPMNSATFYAASFMGVAALAAYVSLFIAA